MAGSIRGGVAVGRAWGEVSSVHKVRARRGARAWTTVGLGRRGQGEGVTLGEEVSFVLPTPHSKDPIDLVWVGRIEEERSPRALGGCKVRVIG
jgi:hypothetical protein